MVNSFDVIPQNNFLIECFITIVTGMANGQVDAIAMIPQCIVRIESRWTRFTMILPFVTVTLHVPFQKTSTVVKRKMLYQKHSIQATRS